MSAATEREGINRLVLLDLMRTVALLRVVVFHVTGLDPLTWIASMPVMFFVAGALFARSMRSRRGLIVIRDRFRRILPSLFVFAAALVGLYAALGLLGSGWSSTRADGSITQIGLYDIGRLFFPLLSGEPPVGPGTQDSAVFWTWNPLWYIHTHLMLALFGPLLLAAYTRWRRISLGVLALIWLLDAIGSGGTMNTFTFLVFFVAGFAFDDGRLLAVPRRTMRWLTVVFAIVGFAFIPAGPGIGINGWVPSLLLIGAAWVTGSLAWRDVLERVGAGRLARPVIAFVNRRALTIYLWSLAGVYVSRRLLPPEGDLLDLALAALGSLAITTVVTAAAVVAFGWIEDLAARRPAEWWPGRGRWPGGGRTSRSARAARRRRPVRRGPGQSVPGAEPTT